ncbi:MAG: hypothetical protein QOJ90_2139 [Actinomycetota bacterium]|nr:hypothetical protein [Actinomycetota bacterium]
MDNAGRAIGRLRQGGTVTTARGRHARNVPADGEVRRGRTLATVGAVAAACAGVAAGATWAGGWPHDAIAGTPQPAARLPAAVRPLVAPDWPALLTELDTRRSAAFASGDARRLDGVDAPGSPALRRDQALLSRLGAEGLTAGGVRLRASSVRLTRGTGIRAELTVVDSLLPYWLVAKDETVATARPGRGPQRWSVTLARVSAGWRVFDVRRL